MSCLKLAMVVGLALVLVSCGGDDLVLPDEGTPAAISIVRGNNQSATVGATLPDSLVVKVVDREGRPVPSQSVSFDVIAGGGSVAPTDARTDANGLAGVAWTLGTGAGAQQVLAKPVGNGTPSTVQVTFSANAGASTASTLSLVSGDDQTATAGTALPDSLVVRATDTSGNPVAGVTVTWTLTGGGAVSATTVATGPDGRSAVRRTLGATAGAQTTIATAAGLDGSPITLSATATVGSAGRLIIDREPSSTASSGAPFVVQPRVQLADANGNPVATSGISVQAQIASGPAGATLSGVFTGTTNASGLASFVTLGISGPAGSYTLNFVVPNRDDISGSPPSRAINLTAGSATRLDFTVQPGNLVAGGTITPAVRVRIEDALGNPVTGATNQVTVAFGANPGGATLGGTRTVAAVAGVATFSTLTVNKPANGYTLQASASGLSGDVSSSFNVSTGSAANIAAIPPTTFTATAGSPVSPAPSVKVTDGAGNPVAGVSVTFAVTAGGGSVSGESQTTGSDGEAAVGSWVLGTTAGSSNNQLRATSAGLSGSPVTFTASATAGSAGKLTIEGTEPSSGQSGSVLTPNFVLQLRDANDNPVTIGGIEIAAAIASGPGGSLAGATENTNSQGRATFNALEINGPSGTYTISFSGTNITGVTSGNIVIGSGAATRLDLATPPSSSVESGVNFPQQPVVQLEDASGNPVGTSGVTVTVTTQSCSGKALGGNNSVETNSSGEATFTDLRLTGTVGNCTLLFAASGLTSVSSSPIAVGAGPVSASTSTVSASPGTVTAGGSGSTVTVTARDGSNNLISGASVSVQTTAGGGTLTPGSGTTNASGVFTSTYTNTASGDKTVEATVDGVTVGQAAITVNPAAPAESNSSLTVEPSAVTAGSPATVSVTVQDEFGNPVSGVNVALGTDADGAFGSGSVITGAGGTASTSYTPNAAGTHNLGATVGAFIESAQLAVTAGSVSEALSSLTFAAPEVLAYGPSASGQVVLRDQLGNPVGGRLVTMEVSGLGQLMPGSGFTTAAGTLDVSFEGTEFGDNAITASIDGSSVELEAGMGVVTAPVDVDLSSISVEFASFGHAGENFQIYANPRGGDGAFLNGALTRFVFEGTDIVSQAPPDSGWNEAPGVAGAHGEIFRTTVAQTVTIRMFVNQEPVPVVREVEVTPSSIVGEVVASGDTPIPQGGSSNISVTVRDEFGNFMQGEPVTFAVTAGIITPESVPADENGMAAAVFSPPATPGPYDVTVGTSFGPATTVTVDVTE